MIDQLVKKRDVLFGEVVEMTKDPMDILVLLFQFISVKSL